MEVWDSATLVSCGAGYAKNGIIYYAYFILRYFHVWLNEGEESVKEGVDNETGKARLYAFGIHLGLRF